MAVGHYQANVPDTCVPDLGVVTRGAGAKTVLRYVPVSLKKTPTLVGYEGLGLSSGW